MPENILNLHVGKMIQLQRISPEKHDRFTVMLIGSLPGQGIIVTTPVVRKKVQLIQEGVRFAVRLLHGSKVLGFVVTVTHSSSKPYPHLHMSYPKEIESLAIRNAERVSTNLPALVRNVRYGDDENAWQPVLVKDLSMTGARLESIEPLGRTGEQLVMKLDIEVCGESEQLTLVTEICNRAAISDRLDREQTRYACGVSYLKIDRTQEVLLNSCVLQLKAGDQ